MSKYYTPSVEEVHIGFRYEAHEMPHNADIWIPTEFDVEQLVEFSFLCNEEFGPVSEWCRVKYLAKEDIEELGWVRHSEPGIVTTGGVPELYEILITKRRRPKRFKLSRGGALMSVNTIEIREYVTKLNSKLIFRGEIKNYNELKRLMKQIGII